MSIDSYSSNILMLTRYSRLGGSSRLRFLEYIPYLIDAGFKVTFYPLFDNDYLEALYGNKNRFFSVLKSYKNRLLNLFEISPFDLVFLEKEALPFIPYQIESFFLKRANILVVDYDDAVFHRYDLHSNFIVRKILGKKIDSIMRLADLVTVGSRYLGERAIKAGCSRVEYIPTVVDLKKYNIQVSHKEKSVVTIGWIGSPSTARYLKLIAKPLQKISEKIPIKCVAIGARQDQLIGTPFQALPWREEKEVEYLSNLDIGIMPLSDEPWEKGKCGFKLIQYMAVGLPVIASPVGINSEIVLPGYNGILADSESEWIDAIERLARDAMLRKRMGEAGRNLVEERYSLQVQVPRMISMFQSLIKTK